MAKISTQVFVVVCACVLVIVFGQQAQQQPIAGGAGGPSPYGQLLQRMMMQRAQQPAYQYYGQTGGQTGGTGNNWYALMFDGFRDNLADFMDRIDMV